MTDAHAAVSQKRGINPIWLVPIVAVLLGAWMVIYTIQSQGPEITITFSTAEGITEGKTKVKLRNVDVGLVEDVRLGDDQESVLVTASLEKEAASLLREQTQFWVVRPRIGKSGISGLGTLLSGGYIQLAPGEGAEGTRSYVGLEEPPVTPAGTPGIRVVLTAEKAGSVGVGDPVLYQGYTVGRVETEVRVADLEKMRYVVFISAPYDKKLTRRHRFWDASGVTARAGADGIEVEMAALDTLLIGGVEVGLPHGVDAGSLAESGETFRLYKSFEEVNERPYRHSLEYVVDFTQSVRGLKAGAPVEYRGLHIGRVERIMLTEMAENIQGHGQQIPILIRIEPARVELPDSPEGVEQMRESIEIGVPRGLRASLATGNLLTGSLFISMNFYPDAEPAALGSYADFPMIPTISSGLAGIEHQLITFLAKLNDLPLEGVVTEAQQTLSSIDRLLGSDEMQAVPATLDATLEKLGATLASLSGDSELQARLLPTITQLERTLSSLRQVLDTLERQPSALIFDRKYGDDPRPPAGSQ
jgi:paraquat-inducible protein B